MSTPVNKTGHPQCRDLKMLSFAVGAVVGASLAGSPVAEAGFNPFGVKPLAQGYMVAESEARCGEGKCGADPKAGEGKCGEGKCGGDAKAEENNSGGEPKAKEARCGEGKCGEGKCGEEKPAKPKEMACGEGKCGSTMHRDGSHSEPHV